MSDEEEIRELIARLGEVPLAGASFGGPYVGVSHNEVTRALLAKGRGVIPALVARLEESGLTETIFIVFLLRELRAKEAKGVVAGLLASGRFDGQPRDLTLEMQIQYFLRDVSSW